MAGYKTLTVSEEAYEKLLTIKQSSESFTDTILRLSRGHAPLSRHAGRWKKVDDTRLRKVFDEIEREWRKGWSSTQQTHPSSWIS